MAQMPEQKPGRSKQDYTTPTELLKAVAARLCIRDFSIDLAATKENAICPYYYSLEEGRDSLGDNSWQAPDGEGWAWLNPPYADIKPWVKKACEESEKGAQIVMLVPASPGANWWAAYVDDIAYVTYLNGRITFGGTLPNPKTGKPDPYPKDCALLFYTPWGFKGSEIWSWQRHVPQLQQSELGEDQGVPKVLEL